MEQSGSFEPAGAPGRHRIESSTDVIAGILRDIDAARAAGAEGSSSSDALATAARRICQAARRDGLSIEQTIISVKAAWRATPGRPKPRSGGTDAQLDQLVSLCIREFYSDR